RQLDAARAEPARAAGPARTGAHRRRRRHRVSRARASAPSCHQRRARQGRSRRTRRAGSIRPPRSGLVTCGDRFDTPPAPGAYSPFRRERSMSDHLTRLFEEYDRGRLSRRRLLQALGLAAAGAAALRPAAGFAQGQCGGARANLPECDPTPAKLPFERTGWKTVVLDHFSCQAVDYQKEAAFYQALMNWKIVADDGKQATLDINGWGAVVIRGGYQPPPAPETPPPAAQAGRGGPRPPRNAVYDGFCWGIEPWDAKKVEAALKQRGLNPVADNRGKDFESFHVKDPDGFDLQISNGNRRNRRQGAPSGKTSAPAPFEPTNWRTIWLDHISFEVSNYKETVAFYTALLGWKAG